MVLVCGFEMIMLVKLMSREWDLNSRPADYESAALPLSYLGMSIENLRICFGKIAF